MTGVMTPEVHYAVCLLKVLTSTPGNQLRSAHGSAASPNSNCLTSLDYVCSFVRSCVCITNKSGNLNKKQRRGNTTQHGHLRSLMMRAGQKKKLFERNADRILFMPTHAWYFIQQIMLNKSWVRVWLARREQRNAKLSIQKSTASLLVMRTFSNSRLQEMTTYWTYPRTRRGSVWGFVYSPVSLVWLHSCKNLKNMKECWLMHNKQEELNPEHVLLKLSWTPVTQIYHIQILHWLHVPQSEERCSVSATFKCICLKY